MGMIERALDAATKIEDHVMYNGLPGLTKKGGLDRFSYMVKINHQDGSVFTYDNAYCVCWEKMLIVIPEHHQVGVFFIDDLEKFYMCKRVKIPNAEKMKI